MLRVMTVDDNHRFRETLKQHLQQEPEVTVVGEACDGEEALRLACELKPDLVLMDISMPRLNGLEATRRVKAIRPQIKVIVVTIHNEDSYRQAVDESGGDGFIAKKELSTELLPTIRRVMGAEPKRCPSESSR